MTFFYEMTALHIALEKDNQEIIKTLLSCQNIDVNIKYLSGFFDFSGLLVINIGYDAYANKMKSDNEKLSFSSGIISIILCCCSDFRIVREKLQSFLL